MKYLPLIILPLLLMGCGKNGMYIETGPDYKGRMTAGWGPMTVLDADIAGPTVICIPAKKAVETNDNWCTKMKTLAKD